MVVARLWGAGDKQEGISQRGQRFGYTDESAVDISHSVQRAISR